MGPTRPRDFWSQHQNNSNRHPRPRLSPNSSPRNIPISLGRVSFCFLRAFVSCAGTYTVDFHSRFQLDPPGHISICNSKQTSQSCYFYMSGKQPQGGVQSDCKFDGARRTPFVDITNVLSTQGGQHDELLFPPPQSRTLNRAAMQIENDSRIPGSEKARNSLAKTGVPPRNRRVTQPYPLTSLTLHYGLPSLLENARSSLPVKVAGVSPIPLSGSVLHPRRDSLRSKPSRQQTWLGSGALTQYPNNPDDLIDDVLPYDAPDIKLPLPSHSRPSPREPLSATLLPPKTHKLAGGQLAVLPSRSVLVDFREGERRAGRKGDEVMVVSPNGDQVRTFPTSRSVLLKRD